MYTHAWFLARRYLAQFPQGRKAARIRALFRVLGELFTSSSPTCCTAAPGVKGQIVCFLSGFFVVVEL